MNLSFVAFVFAGGLLATSCNRSPSPQEDHKPREQWIAKGDFLRIGISDVAANPDSPAVREIGIYGSEQLRSGKALSENQNRAPASHLICELIDRSTGEKRPAQVSNKAIMQLIRSIQDGGLYDLPRNFPIVYLGPDPLKPFVLGKLGEKEFLFMEDDESAMPQSLRAKCRAFWIRHWN